MLVTPSSQICQHHKQHPLPSSMSHRLCGHLCVNFDTVQTLTVRGSARNTIGQTRIKENTEDDWKSIKETFGPTIIKRAEPRDKAYYNDKLLDHACPYTIRSGSGYF